MSRIRSILKKIPTNHIAIRRSIKITVEAGISKEKDKNIYSHYVDKFFVLTEKQKR